MRSPARAAALVLLALALPACHKAPPDTDEPDDAPPAEGGMTTRLNGRVLAGQGSGVVGVPLEGVEITLHLGEQAVGPVMTDASGSLSVDALPLFPAGTVDDPASLSSAAPLNVEVHFALDGYRPNVEIVTFPVDRYREFTFYLKGEGE